MKEATQAAQTNLIFYQIQAHSAFPLTLVKVAIGAFVISVNPKANLELYLQVTRRCCVQVGNENLII